MWHKPCRTFHPWCPCIKTRCLFEDRVPADEIWDYNTVSLYSTLRWYQSVLKFFKWVAETWLQDSITNDIWWRHQLETFPALLALCARNSPVTGEFPSQRPVTRSFDVFFDLRLNKRLSKQSQGWWFETPSCPFWRHCNEPAPCTLPTVYVFE